jgi:sigma-70-like protein
MAPAALPILTAEPGLVHYLEEIRRFPMLERQEEYMLARRWRERGDCDAAHTLVTSHLRLVAKIARDYRGYGLPISEAISEGNVGLVQAVERFEPEKGFRLARPWSIAMSSSRSRPSTVCRRFTRSVYSSRRGLMSYGTDFVDLYRQAASYVDRIPARCQARRLASAGANQV